MPNRTQRELWVGSLAAAFLTIVFAFTAFNPGQQASSQGEAFLLKAEFNRIDGLTVGSPVRLAGVDVGQVNALNLTEEGRAEVELVLFNTELPIPTDTAAVIETDGLFGDKYVELHPGGELDNFQSDQRLSYTQDSVVLESLLNQIVSRARAQRESASGSMGQGEEP